ncbi:ribonuclease E activity regulator RraA [Bacillus marinisedimentorum]|uniref:ribonuclease E activity regulator RraA n=1 Tax=Bacillus marinisedimentorum TaxID=1821260 RepID=UPI000871CAC3|nr:ribonuclease E activity regulator RraA [Bacillus marinisedimentorum]
MNVKTADLCDDYASELAICKKEFKHFGKVKRFYGPIHTVDVFEDNVLVREALETVPEGSVLVVDGGGSRNVALMGDRLGDIAVSRKLAGVIIHGCVRDSADLNELEVGIRALGTVPLKSKKEGKGERDIVLSFGEIEWTPGHYVYADEDGIVVASRNVIEQ